MKVHRNVNGNKIVHAIKEDYRPPEVKVQPTILTTTRSKVDTPGICLESIGKGAKTSGVLSNGSICRLDGGASIPSAAIREMAMRDPRTSSPS